MSIGEFEKSFDISKIILKNEQKNVKIEYLIDRVFLTSYKLLWRKD